MLSSSILLGVSISASMASSPPPMSTNSATGLERMVLSSPDSTSDSSPFCGLGLAPCVGFKRSLAVCKKSLAMNAESSASVHCLSGHLQGWPRRRQETRRWQGPLVLRLLEKKGNRREQKHNGRNRVAGRTCVTYEKRTQAAAALAAFEANGLDLAETVDGHQHVHD